MTNEEAVSKYLEYLEGHINNVNKALDILLTLDIPFVNDNRSILKDILIKHDISKYDEPEWTGYLHHWYSTSEEDKLKTEEYEAACRHHIENNPHHWDFWIVDNKLIDNIDEFEYKLYTVERLCDHMAMSIQNGNKPKDWYYANKENIIMPDYGYSLYEEMLNKLPDDYDLPYHGTRANGKPERDAKIEEHLLGLNREYIKKLGKRAKIGNNGTAVSIKPTFSSTFDEFIDKSRKEQEKVLNDEDSYPIKKKIDSNGTNLKIKKVIEESILTEVKASQMMNKTKSEDPARVEKSKRVSSKYIGMSKFGILNFKTTSESRPGGYHYETVEFQSLKPFEDIIKQGKEIMPNDIKKELENQDLNVFCGCESWSYWAWYYQAYQNDYAYIDDNIPNLDKRIQAPKVNNVRLKGALCKHLVSVFDYLKRPFVLYAISEDIKKYLINQSSDKMHSQDIGTQNWYDAVAQWNEDDIKDYTGLSREQIIADLSKSIELNPNIQLDDYLEDIAKETLEKNGISKDTKLERQVADKVKDEYNLEDEYNNIVDDMDKEEDADDIR